MLTMDIKEDPTPHSHPDSTETVHFVEAFKQRTKAMREIAAKKYEQRERLIEAMQERNRILQKLLQQTSNSSES